MKKISLVLVIVLMSVVAFGAGLVDNGNQSAAYIRTMNRNVSTGVDAVYFNPAGLTKLKDGLYMSFSNQSIWQEKEIVNNYAALNEDTYIGDIKAMLFPDFYAVYKTGKLAMSLGVMPIGGGGGADYKTGLPSFALNLAQYVGLPAGALNPALAPMGNITGYESDIVFEGSSIYLAGQFNVSFAVNDMISVSAGGRYITATNTYVGSLKNNALITQLGGGATGTDPGRIDATIDPVTFGDKEVDAEQNGTAMNGSVGLFLDFDKLQVALNYTTQAKLEMENDTKTDDVGMFPDGAKSNADMPAILATGLAYKLSPKLRVETNFNYYFNTNADWDGDEDNVDNGMNVGLAVEYKLSDKLLASVGYIYDTKGIKEAYQNDLGFALDNQSIGTGINYKLSDGFCLDLGVSNTFYTEYSKDGTIALTGATYTETYNKTALDVAIGVTYKLF